ncbi:hypothetical protein GCM10027276_14500 [Comamonas piscis]
MAPDSNKYIFTWENIPNIISFLANSTTIIASSIAIYIFICKRKEIKNAFALLMNWTFQLTLNDLRSKLERLMEYNANEPAEIEPIKNILHEVAGQIRGNKKLMQLFPEIAEKFERLSGSKKLSEPAKRAIISELRENLRNAEINEIIQQDNKNV